MSTKNKILTSLIGAVILLIIGYFTNNQSLFTQERVICYSIGQHLLGDMRRNYKNYDDSVFYVDVSANKKMYSYKDSTGTLLSFNDWLTDRDVLNQFINCCRKAGGYRYIIVDLRFEVESNSIIDSTLFSTINNTPNIVIAKNNNRDISYQYIDENKIAIAEYPIADNLTNFTRFQLYVENEQTIYTKVYQDLSGNKITKFGALFFDNNRLCHNSIFTPLEANDKFEVITTEQFEEFDEDDIPVTHVNSVSELLDSLEINDIPQYIKGKYVVIGNFKDDDKHDTYVGDKQGAELVFNAVMNLNNQKHIVNWLFAFVLFVFYFGVIYLISSNKSLKDNLPFIRRSKSKILHFVFSF